MSSNLSELGLIGTIEDNNSTEPTEVESDEEIVPVKKTKLKNKKKDDFFEGFAADNSGAWADDDVKPDYIASHVKLSSITGSTLDEKIAKVRQQKWKEKQKQNGTSDEKMQISDDDDSGDEEEENYSSSEDENLKTDTIKEKLKKKKKSAAKTTDEPKIVYADEVTSVDNLQNFGEFDLRRPLQKALTALRYNKPTPIQSATIPLALKGRDICACSATGTGKTAAFMIPTLERLLYRDTRTPVTRVLVLAPTRELAIQIYEESRKLAQFTDITISLSTGGLDIKTQEAALRQSPDIVIATPGRLIDHLRNAPSFNLANIEVLILDEADRMLDEFFLEQMKEVVRLCSNARQTMLFSATMTENVKDLATVSLTNPIKVFVNENKDIAFNLQQEFIRIRPHMEGDREAIVAALIRRTFREQCIVFIQTKKEAHRMHLVLGLLGVRVGELHGNLSQPQRLDALRKFKEGEINVLIATDLAARGLDIDGVKTIINLTMPSNIERYIHRVGRTARAGKSGRSVSLSGEKERHLLHEISKRSAKAGRPVLCRTVPQKVIERYRDRIHSLEMDISEIENAEREEKELRVTELKVNKAKNLLEHHDEIMSRPKRTWFQTHTERMQDIVAQKLGKFSALPNNSKKAAKIKQTMTPEERVDRELQKAAAFGARSAKRQFKEKRIRAFDDDDDKGQHSGKKKKKKTHKKSSFDRELTSTSKKSLKQFKAGGRAGSSLGGKMARGGNRNNSKSKNPSARQPRNKRR